MSGRRPQLVRVVGDPEVGTIVVEHRDRLARVGVEHQGAVLAGRGRRVVVAESSPRMDDLVRDMVEVLTAMCARLYGRRGARNRAMRAVTATNRWHVLPEFAGRR
jgi:putative resolvase